MPTPLLKTELYVPRVRPELVARPRLIERLDAGLRRKLTLISAPAGFGKTTLLSEWVAGCTGPVGWVSLDESDNDPVRFWRYVIAALQTVDVSLGQAVQAALAAASLERPPLDAVVTSLINDFLAVSQGGGPTSPCVLVLDDYHVIEAEAVHRSLSFLLDHLPPQLHLVIAGRSDPPLPLSRLRGRDQLTELRSADLRFRPDEVAAFLNQATGLALSPQHIAALEARTEGWIVGLQMAAFALQGALSMGGRDPGRIADFVAAFAGSHRYILDYLTDEVLLQQPGEVQTFLLRTAILDRLCGPLRDAVTRGPSLIGEGSGQDMLERLEAANLFVVPLDHERRWYRDPPLFADLVRQRLRRMQPDLLPGPHHRASEWYEGEGIIPEAVSHALAGPDYGRAADLVQQHALATMFRGEMMLIRHWLEALPEDMVRSRPILCIVSAWITLLISPEGTDIAERWIQDAERASSASPCILDHPDLPYQTVRDLVTAHAAVLHMKAVRDSADRPQKVLDLSPQALEVVPEGDTFLRGAVALFLGQAHLRAGNEEAADPAFDLARQMGEASDGHIVALVGASSRAQVAWDRGRLRAAAAICREALQSLAKPAERAGQRLAIAGALVDRWDRRRLMLVADGFIALVSAWLVYLFWADAMQIWHVYLIMLARAIGGCFHFPAMQASTSLMVPKEHLSRVAGLNQTMHGALSVASPPLGALLLDILPLHAIMALDVITAAFAMGPLLLVHIHAPSGVRRAPFGFAQSRQGSVPRRLPPRGRAGHRSGPTSARA